MSEFLMVVPEGWNEVEGDIAGLIDAAGGEASVLDALTQSVATIESVIEPLGLPPAGMTVTDCRLFSDGGVMRMWVKYASLEG